MPAPVIHTLTYAATVDQLRSTKFHALTTNGPFLDAHFGQMSPKAPVGQTYYIRPLTTYTKPCKRAMKTGCGCGGKGGGKISFQVRRCFPAVHANKNAVSEALQLDGTVTITPFEWGTDGKAKEFGSQKIVVNMVVYNRTGLPMTGFHVHDGQMNNGLVGFGPISYFLYTTPSWVKKYNTSRASQKWTAKHLKPLLGNVSQHDPTFLLART